MRRDGTPDEFDRDREEFEDREQVAKQALDLRAVEARLAEYLDNDNFPSAAFKDLVSLIAYCRALRAGAQEALDAYGWQSNEAHQRCDCPRCKLAAMLAQATDGKT